MDLADLKDLGAYPWQAWENSSRIRNKIADQYDWVKYTDDFPVGCITWCRFN